MATSMGWSRMVEGDMPTEAGEVEGWMNRNLAALHAIQISCAQHVLDQIRNEIFAKKTCSFWPCFTANHPHRLRFNQ
ncbi:hypothetical protein CCACVL1_02203, partial [Corchorus capsularis]